MSEEKKEFWFDSFEVALGVHGSKLVFNLANYNPREPGKEAVAVAYASIESLKSMAFVLARAIRQNERQTGVSYPIPNKTLNEWNIAPEDWEVFWK